MSKNEVLEKVAYDAAERINAECNKTTEIKDTKKRVVGVQFDFHVKPATAIIAAAIRAARPTFGERIILAGKMIQRIPGNLLGFFLEWRDNR